MDIREEYQKNRALVRSLLSNTQSLKSNESVSVQIIEPEVIITESVYILEEKDLPVGRRGLLHGRAFVISNAQISAIHSDEAITYYIVSDKLQGLVVPGRAAVISNSGPGNIFYRWTDNGEKWTDWITLVKGQTDTYNILEKNRFAELQVYSNYEDTRVSLRVSR